MKNKLVLTKRHIVTQTINNQCFHDKFGERSTTAVIQGNSAVQMIGDDILWIERLSLDTNQLCTTLHSAHLEIVLL